MKTLCGVGRLGPRFSGGQKANKPFLLKLLPVLTPLCVKTLVQAAWVSVWRARKSVMTRW